MNIHEYQAKEILKKFGLPILNGKSYEKNLDLLQTELKDLKGPPWVVKSQIHAGGRGAGHFKNSFNDKGGVQVIFEKDEVSQVASSMMGNTLVTKQTGARFHVRVCLEFKLLVCDSLCPCRRRKSSDQGIWICGRSYIFMCVDQHQ